LKALTNPFDILSRRNLIQLGKLRELKLLPALELLAAVRSLPTICARREFRVRNLEPHTFELRIKVGYDACFHPAFAAHWTFETGHGHTFLLRKW
jgi:hypothetical protein